MLKDKAQALLTQRAHIEELQGLVRNTTAPMLQVKVIFHNSQSLSWKSLIQRIWISLLQRELLDEKSKSSSLEKQLARETSTLRSLQKSLDMTSVDLELNSSRTQTKVVNFRGCIIGFALTWLSVKPDLGNARTSRSSEGMTYELVVCCYYFSFVNCWKSIRSTLRSAVAVVR